VLGDAAEYYALSQFAFAGRPGTKMPDNWDGYDLAVETGTETGKGTGLKRVSVKLHTESDGWNVASWFLFDDRRECDWVVFIFKQKDGTLRSWIIPFAVAVANANLPDPKRKDPWMRAISFEKLATKPLCDVREQLGIARVTFSGPDLLRSVTVLENVVNCHTIFDRMTPVDSAE